MLKNYHSLQDTCWGWIVEGPIPGYWQSFVTLYFTKCEDTKSITNYDEKAIKRAAMKTNDKQKVKKMVKLFKQYSWDALVVESKLPESDLSSALCQRYCHIIITGDKNRPVVKVLFPLHSNDSMSFIAWISCVSVIFSICWQMIFWFHFEKKSIKFCLTVILFRK